MISEACHVTQNKSPIHLPISHRKEIKCAAEVKILAKSHAFLDRFRSKQFCGFLLLWPTIEAKDLYQRSWPLGCFITLGSYANLWLFDTSSTQTGTKRRDFDILHVPFMHPRSSGRRHVFRP